MFVFFSALAFANDFMIDTQAVVHTELDNGLDMIWIDDGNTTIDLYTVYAAGAYMETKPSLAHLGPAMPNQARPSPGKPS